MTQLSMFPVLLASIHYDRDDLYEVTIYEYELKGHLCYDTGRQWVRDTRDNPVDLLLREFELRIAP